MKFVHAFLTGLIVLTGVAAVCSRSLWSTVTASAAEPTAKTAQYVFGTETLARYQFPTHITDLVIDRAQAAYAEVFVVVIRPNHAPPVHKHDDMEQIFYMLSGHGTLSIGSGAAQQQLRVKPGDVVRIPISTFHSIKADAEADLKYLSVDCFGPNRGNSEPNLGRPHPQHVQRAGLGLQ
jgi:quercetin dioxygenase-like cupin family protein